MKRSRLPFYHLTLLDEVREIMWAVFYSYYFNKIQLVGIHGPGDELFFRINPPVRISLHGSPLLVSVIDARRIREGKVNRGQLDQDYERLVRDGVHRETRYIYAHSDEEVHLLRYLLNVNSTKMRRSVAVEEPSSRGGHFLDCNFYFARLLGLDHRKFQLQNYAVIWRFRFHQSVAKEILSIIVFILLHHKSRVESVCTSLGRGQIAAMASCFIFILKHKNRAHF